VQSADGFGEEARMEAEALAFLKDRFPEALDVRIEGFRTIAGGYSRETYYLEGVVEHGDGRAERQALFLRKDPAPEVGILSTSRQHEHDLLNRLHSNTSIPVPRSLYLDASGSAFGRPAMLLERAAGTSDLSQLFGGADADQLESVATDLCEKLAELHCTSLQTLDPNGVYNDPRGEGIDVSSWQPYMASNIAYFKRNYANIAYDALPVFYDAYCALQHRLPQPVALRLVHGDFQPSNFLYRDGKVSGLIDWENAHVGDPREDIGWLAHMQLLSNIDLMSAVKQDGGFLQHYTKLSGIPISEDDVNFFRLFTASAVGSPIMAAVKRRLDNVHQELTHIYIIQAVIVSASVFAAVLGYPQPEETI
jgi:aminoglycoside phosphotransferase (APT) family kinase protein